MKWFRFYSEALHDPKVQRLHPSLFKHWINLLCLANESADRGVLPCVDDVAFALRIKPAKASEILVQLAGAGLLDTTEDGRYVHHGWTRRQRESDDVATRVRRHRDANTTRSERGSDAGVSNPRQLQTGESAAESENRDECNVTGALPETLPKRAVDTDTDTDTDTELTPTPPPRKRAREKLPDPSPEAEQVADILVTAPWINDEPDDVARAVERAFSLAPRFNTRDGPLLAEQHVRWRGYAKKPPTDWYQAWLNWIKREAKDHAAEHQPHQNGRTTGKSRAGGGEDFDAYVGIARHA